MKKVILIVLMSIVFWGCTSTPDYPTAYEAVYQTDEDVEWLNIQKIALTKDDRNLYISIQVNPEFDGEYSFFNPPAGDEFMELGSFRASTPQINIQINLTAINGGDGASFIVGTTEDTGVQRGGLVYIPQSELQNKLIPFVDSAAPEILQQNHSSVQYEDQSVSSQTTTEYRIQFEPQGADVLIITFPGYTAEERMLLLSNLFQGSPELLESKYFFWNMFKTFRSAIGQPLQTEIEMNYTDFDLCLYVLPFNEVDPVYEEMIRIELAIEGQKTLPELLTENNGVVFSQFSEDNKMFLGIILEDDELIYTDNPMRQIIQNQVREYIQIVGDGPDAISLAMSPEEAFRQTHPWVPDDSMIELDEDGNLIRITDRTDYEFVSDPAVIGKWFSVGFAEDLSEFNPENTEPLGSLFLGGLEFRVDGQVARARRNSQDFRVYGTGDRWTNGFVLSDDGASAYLLREFNGQQFLFMEWKNEADYNLRGMKPGYYVFARSQE
jgi:hypothetical protein